MQDKRYFGLIILLIMPFVGYYSIQNNAFSALSNLSIEKVVGIVAILSGLTGIIMGLGSARQASLDAVKEYYQQGDEERYKVARGFISSKRTFKGLDDQKAVSDIVNFYELWGLLNRKYYLPIWVFGGVSGIRIVEMYIRIHPLIVSVRDGSVDPNGEKPRNPFYAKQFEELAYRIYRKYKKNFSETNFEEMYGAEYKKFIKRAYRFTR